MKPDKIKLLAALKKGIYDFEQKSKVDVNQITIDALVYEGYGIGDWDMDFPTIHNVYYLSDYGTKWCFVGEEKTIRSKSKTKLVTLKQYFGGDRPAMKYKYLLENPKKGMLVSDFETYIGQVIEINDIDDNYKYKPTKLINKDEAIKLLKRLRAESISNEYSRELDKIKNRGGYYDPNYGWCDAHELDDFEEDYSPTENEINSYVERVFKELT